MARLPLVLLGEPLYIRPDSEMRKLGIRAIAQELTRAVEHITALAEGA
jgi:hypothetical protein